MENNIVGIGEILWDVFPERKVLGGAPANFAYHASRFGFHGYAVSAIGKDALGQEIRDNLNDKELNCLIESVDYPTGTVQVTLNNAGVPQYEICENVAWDNIPYTPQMDLLAKHCRAVCFGSLAQRNSVSRQTIRRFINQVPEVSYKIFDINLRQHFYSKEIIHESLLCSNVLKINNEEVVEVARLYGYEGMSEQDVCQTLMEEYGLDIVIETRGEEGSYVFIPNETFYMDTPKVQVADTVGAGDSFTGTFVTALLYGKSIRQAHELAVKASAYVCTKYGAMPKLPDNI
jgi:Sugar kinases, ribokinase family